jgi:hypothetical protein
VFNNLTILWIDTFLLKYLPAIAKNTVFRERTKHIEVDRHFVHNEVLKNNIRPLYVSTTTQLADIFTKALGKAQFEILLASWALEIYNRMNLISRSHFQISLTNNISNNYQATIINSTSTQHSPKIKTNHTLLRKP